MIQAKQWCLKLSVARQGFFLAEYINIQGHRKIWTEFETAIT